MPSAASDQAITPPGLDREEEGQKRQKDKRATTRVALTPYTFFLPFSRYEMKKP
jgi:hypothetical protein